MTKDKPTVDEIKEEFEICKKEYSSLFDAYNLDEEFYNLAFKDRLNIPKEFHADRVVLPTARDVVDTGVNHTSINNARVFVNRKSTSEISAKSAEMLRKLGLGIIHGINVESRIAPAHVGAKHYWKHGLAVFKTIWAVDRWIDKPSQKEGESDEEYAIRLDEWRAESHLSLPIIIQAINPACIMPDPYTGGDYYVFEWHDRQLFDAQRIWPHWKNPNGRQPNEKVECVSWWSDKYRCEFVDDEPVLKIPTGIVAHKYGFNPYTLIESGLGSLDKDNAPEKRYVGLLRHMMDLLVSESTNYTLNDILMKRETMKGGYITGADASDITEVKQEYGKYWPVGDKDVQFHDWETKLAPESAYRHLALTHNYIAEHSAPRVSRGLSETGVRSGAERRLMMAEAAAIYRYASPAFANGWANILSKCAMLVKNVIPGDFEIWTRTPTDEFDVTIKKALIKEPFNYYVEFAPISEEDEYRRHDDLERLMSSGIITKKFARTQMSNVDPIAMDREERKELLRQSPSYLQAIDQLMGAKMQEALGGLAPAIAQPGAVEGTPPAMSPAGRRMAAPIRTVPPIGSAEEMQQRLRQQRSPTPISPTQGMGGGGFRP